MGPGGCRLRGGSGWVYSHAHAEEEIAGHGGKQGWLKEVDRAFCWGQFRRRGVGVNLAVSGPRWLGLRRRG